jgi:hypothetical protein
VLPREIATSGRSVRARTTAKDARAQAIRAAGDARRARATRAVERRALAASDEFNAAQDAVVPGEAIAAYPGQWVAVRDGAVVAHAASGDALLDRDAVRDTDVIAWVPPRS